MGAGHHHHGHGHGHGHGQGHGASHGWAFAIAVTLNAGFVVVEVIAGFLSGSTALLADAGHNLSDVAGLVLFLCSDAARYITGQAINVDGGKVMV